MVKKMESEEVDQDFMRVFIKDAELLPNRYKVTKKEFDIFRSHVRFFLREAGIRIPFSISLDVPEIVKYYSPTYTVLYEDNQKLDIYLHPYLSGKPSRSMLFYLALNEVLGFLLTDNFLWMVDKKKVDKSDWYSALNSVRSSIVSLINKDLLILSDHEFEYYVKSRKNNHE